MDISRIIRVSLESIDMIVEIYWFLMICDQFNLFRNNQTLSVEIIRQSL
jgi:hypothetical protein